MIGNLNPQQIKDFLSSQLVGRLGCYSEDQVYIVPLTYFFDGTHLYLHTKEGLKVSMMRENPKVCFEVDQIDNMTNWRSVVVQGTFEELEGREAQEAINTLSTKFMPYITSETFRPQFGLDKRPDTVNAKMQMVVFRINIEGYTGKYEKSS